MTMAGPALFLLTGLPLLVYLAWDIGAHLDKRSAPETWRRIGTVSAFVGMSSVTVAIVISLVSDTVFPSFFQGPGLYIVWPTSFSLLILFISRRHSGARASFKREEETKVEMVNYVDQQLAGRLRPLEGAVAGVQAGLAEVSKLVDLLDKELEHLDPYIQSFARDVMEQTKTVKGLAHEFALREEQYLKVTSQYNGWYDKRMSANRELETLTTAADTMLERSATFVDELDELLDTLGVAGGGQRAPVTTPQGEAGGALHRQDAGQAPSPAAGVDNPPSTTGGKLTKEKGIANRERGNNAQLKFASDVLYPAKKLYDNSIKEGTPDYIFYTAGTPEKRQVKAVGAFKGFTLKEDGTKQRHIPRRKVLAEQRTAMKYAVPLILFVLNFANGRIWATVIKAEELKEFKGQSTPLWLVENNSQAEQACKDSLKMALELL